VIDIDGKDLQESRLSSGGDCIGSVVRVGPCIGAIGETTVRKVVYDAFVWVLLRAHENQTLRDACVRYEATRAQRVLTVPGCADNQYH